MALVVAGVVHNGDVHVTEPHYKTRRQRYARHIGDGVMLTIRIEPVADAYTHGQMKHLYGHLYAPVSKRTGETVAEVHIRMKLQFMPDDGRTSLTQLNGEELKAYTESVEQDIRENDPDSWEDCCAAMALFERRAM